VEPPLPDDRHDGERDRTGLGHDAPDELVLGIGKVEIRLRIGRLDLPREMGSVGGAHAMTREQRLPLRRLIVHGAHVTEPVVLVPQHHGDAVAINDLRQRVGELLRHLVGGGCGSRRLGQPEQRVGTRMLAARVVERGRGLEDRRRVARVHLEQIALLREEPAGPRRRHQPAEPVP
jgi:hypothetical protein